MNWQRTNVQAAAAYLRDRMAAGASDVRTKAVYEGLLDVLQPTRRAARQQREAVLATRASVSIAAARERRTKSDRRAHLDRRRAHAGNPSGVERRSGGERRSGRERRGR